ncbi:ABC transporter permease subunit [bacterium]|nr:ABC transporter permease subunit [bacterium]
MPVLTKVEAKGIKGRLFQAGVLLALIVGGTTMVYPFLLMLAGSVRSDLDAAEIDVLPNFLADRSMLTRKFLEMKYDYNVTLMNLHRGYQDFSFRQATLPEAVIAPRVDDLREFVGQAEMPNHWWALGGTVVYKKIAAANSTRFVERLQERYHHDLRALGEDLGAPIPKWRYVSLTMPEWASPRYQYQPSPFFDVYFKLLHDRPLAERAFVSLRDWFLQNAVFPTYGKGDVQAYNAAHARPIASYAEFSLPRTVPGPDQPLFRQEWLAFVSEMLNASFIRANVPAARYQEFLADKYQTIERLNQRWEGTTYRDFSEIAPPAEKTWVPAAQATDYRAFLVTVPPESLCLVGPEYAWQDWLRTKYGAVAALNEAHQAPYEDWAQSRIPLAELELEYVQANAREVAWESATRNFRNVFSEVLFQGRPFLNTVIFVILSLLLSLTVQPLAAYGLSRFSPPGTWRIILILMATMAFPPMVGMIPQFLILRKLHLLNTFAALVLPVIVNGYLVFLLKGFFDSLPQHLYEAALIDGAGELRMFWEITMALSKPILAVVALSTFNLAWLAFMYPLLVCPREEMHVLAIWLYEFQQTAPTPAVFASILVTSIPMLLIFLFAQRTIMRGIAVPAEK